jgi:hypothetical protein
MPSVYTWNKSTGGSWETPSNWTSSPSAPNTYPSLTGDAAICSNTTGSVSISLGNTIALSSFSIGPSSSGSTISLIFSLTGNGAIQFDTDAILRRGGAGTGSSRLSNVDVIVRSASNSPIKISGVNSASPTLVTITAASAVNLTNPLNSIYQIARNGSSNLTVAFGSAEALGISHPTHIFDPSAYINSTVTQLEYTGSLSTYVNKSIWDISLGTPFSGTVYFNLVNQGTGLFKIGRVGQTFTIGSSSTSLHSSNIYLYSNSLGTSSDSNEFKEAVYSQAAGNLAIRKYGTGRWILSEGATVQNPTAAHLVSFTVFEGVLQIPIDKVTIRTGSTIKPFYLGYNDTPGPTSSSATLELSGTGTINIQDVTFNKRLYYGASGLGVFRTVSGANVTISSTFSTLSTQNFNKVSTELNSILNMEYLSISTNTIEPNFYVSGEGTCVLPKSFTSPSTGYSLVKQDSGTLKITESDKAATVQYIVEGGTLYVDGKGRIAAGNLVQVNNTATLQTTDTSTGSAINVKALTLAAGSTVMVGGT